MSGPRTRGGAELGEDLDAESDLVILPSESSSITEIQHVVNPGRYRIETDGRLTAAGSIRLDLKANMGAQ